jgi:hypothetical protein
MTILSASVWRDFLSTNADGRIVDKQGWLDFVGAGHFPVDKITTDDFKVRRYSGTAVITGRSAYHYRQEARGSTAHAGLGQSEWPLAVGQLAGYTSV